MFKIIKYPNKYMHVMCFLSSDLWFVRWRKVYKNVLVSLTGKAFPQLKESDAMFSAEKAPEWKDADCCSRCRTTFGVVNRKVYNFTSCKSFEHSDRNHCHMPWIVWSLKHQLSYWHLEKKSLANVCFDLWSVDSTVLLVLQ